MATIREVSELAGVSQATVSRVINGSDKVVEETKQRVHAAMQQLGYRPNTHARSLATNRSDSVGLLVAELDGPFYGPLMSGVESVLREHQKHVLIASAHSNEDEEREGIEFLLQRNCDALIVHAEALSDDYLIELCRGKTPVVLINRLVPDVAEHCVFLDNELGGRIATEHLLSQGHEQVACITGPLWKKDARDRLQGYRLALQHAGLSYDESLVVEGDFREQGGVRAINKLLERNQEFSAVFCCNDEMACGAIDTLRSAGHQVPEQVSLMGYDNVNFAYFLSPKLSTVHFPIYEMAQMATKQVLNSVYGKRYPLQQRFEPFIEARNSVLPLSTEMPKAS